MPLLSTPRIADLRSCMPFAGTTAPGSPSTPFMPGTRVRRAAHDLQRLAFAGADGQHLQLVGIGVRPGGEHFGDAEPGQPFRRVLDPLDLEADAVERRGDLRGRRLGFEEILQPFERELHAT